MDDQLPVDSSGNPVIAPEDQFRLLSDNPFAIEEFIFSDGEGNNGDVPKTMVLT